jgi:PIN domain nuclease of toxin-antitoxin system
MSEPNAPLAVTDIHALICAIGDNRKRLGKRAKRLFEQADDHKCAIYIPTFALVELGEACRKGHVTLSRPFQEWTRLAFASGRYHEAPLTAKVVCVAQGLYDIPERGDRLRVPSLKSNTTRPTNQCTAIERPSAEVYAGVVPALRCISSRDPAEVSAGHAGGEGTYRALLRQLAQPQLIQFPLQHRQLVGLFLQDPLLLLYFVEQQGGQLVVANSLHRSFLTVYDKVRIHLLHLFGYEAILKRTIRFILQMKRNRPQLRELVRGRAEWPNGCLVTFGRG